jgi:mannose-6-phosphate isomerase-like protein (cupin superfamily)
VDSIVVRPDEGRSISLGGMGVVFRLFGQDTAGAFAVVEHPMEAGRLTWPHVHVREDELSYVLEGVIGARVGDQVIEAAGVGSYLRKPRGVPHAFWNPGPKPARLLEIISPPGFEAYFVELAEAGDPHRREELAKKYGVTYFSDWIPDLTARYKLKLLGL